MKNITSSSPSAGSPLGILTVAPRQVKHLRPLSQQALPASAVLTLWEKAGCQLTIITMGSTDQCKERLDDIPDECPGLVCNEA